jgi:hypothetical protein
VGKDHNAKLALTHYTAHMSGIFKGAPFRDKPARNIAERKLLSEAPNRH